MPLESRRRHVLLAGALALAGLPASAQAQDGQPVVGPPVTAPDTTAPARRSQPSSLTPVKPKPSDAVLPGVPATASDPAPPGTRAVPIDQPPPAVAPAGRRPAAPVPARAGTTRRPISEVATIEGIVTRVVLPPKDRPEARLMITIDTSRDWDAYVNGLPSRAAVRTEATRDAVRATEAAQAADNAARRADAIGDPGDPKSAVEAAGARDAAERAADAAERAEAKAEEKADDRNLVNLMVTRRTHVFTFPRTPEGVDLYGAPTVSSPDHQTSRTGLTRREVAQSQGPEETNFTNIREGSYVAVRYRKSGANGEALNLSLIELPLDTPTVTPAAGGALVPSTRTEEAPGTHPATVVPDANAAQNPLRIPRVPTDTGGNPGTLPR